MVSHASAFRYTKLYLVSSIHNWIQIQNYDFIFNFFIQSIWVNISKVYLVSHFSFYLAHFLCQIVKVCSSGVKGDICRQNSFKITCIYEQHILQMVSTWRNNTTSYFEKHKFIILDHSMKPLPYFIHFEIWFKLRSWL